MIPDEIDGENFGARVEHGLLTLTLGLHPEAQPRKIAVDASASTRYFSVRGRVTVALRPSPVLAVNVTL